METFIEQAESRRKCLSKIVAKYGERVVLLRERKVRLGGFMGLFTREGFELEFYIPPVVGKTVDWPQGGSSYSQGAAVPSPLEFEEEKKKLLAMTGKDPQQTAAARDASQQKILDELREIKDKIDSAGGKKEDHPSLVRAAELLRANDFSEAYINAMLEKARSELSLETLDDFDEVQNRLLEWIGETIAIYTGAEITPRNSFRRDARIVVLIGPTGVGKTTTIAKLAAIYGIGIDNPGKPPLSVRMITIDAFRIGARAQIENYGNIMGIPVSYIDDKRSLKKEIALYQGETDLILIDTIGKSPRDSAKLGEMKEFLDACGSRAEVHLVLSASTKTSDITEILRQFEPFNYRSVVLSKLDETKHSGNIISALAERKKPVSYITDGQKVPNDIRKASVVRFLINLDNFKVDRERIEKRFPNNGTDRL
ncbi:MAG TPA: flagellar biosynthesis protein FlhF [Treponema sp.]|nr:flagellar biosynthesis protein FlhF [Treponema sp.]